MCVVSTLELEISTCNSRGQRSKHHISSNHDHHHRHPPVQTHRLSEPNSLGARMDEVRAAFGTCQALVVALELS